MGGSTLSKVGKAAAVIFPGISLATAASTAPVVAAKVARDAKKKAEQAGREAEQRGRDLRKDLQDEQNRSDKDASEVGKQARERTRKTSKARRRSTILTSGLGIVGEPETANKSLLGR